MKNYLAFGLSILLLGGCNSDYKEASESIKPGGYTVFDSESGDIAYPNNILFAGSTDGKLRIPYNETDADALIKASLNTLDGFSTTSPITVSVTTELNPASLSAGVKLYKVIAQASEQTGGIPAVGLIQKELTLGTDFVATYSNGKIVILPTKALDANSNYMVVLTNSITDMHGRKLYPDAVTSMINLAEPLVDENGVSKIYFDPNEAINNAKANQLEGLRKLTQAMFLAKMNFEGNSSSCSASATGITCSDTVMSWSFKTQSIGQVAQAFADENSAGQIVTQDINLTSKSLLSLAGFDTSPMTGIADIHSGVLANVPYYLHDANNSHSSDPLTYAFEEQDGTDLPKAQSTQTIPLLVSVPNHVEKPSSGWPVIIFQHGITSDRTALLPISEAFASIGYASIAIDLPLHGLTTESPLKQATERTFDLDLINNETGAAGPDGVTDTSGSHYINLANPLVSRDNVRQSTSDLITLLNSLSTSSIGFDDSKVAFMGHSLGAMASFGFLSHKRVETVSFAMPGGGIAQLLNNSRSFGPIIQAGLAAKGIIKGTSEYDAFMLATQTLVDDADPQNYASSVAQTQGNIYAIEVLEDEVIPNSVTTAPLSGTEPLLTALGSNDINTSEAPGIVPVSANTHVRFTTGTHSSILSPESDINATVEMQTQSASFIQSQGTIIQVTNAAIIAQ